MSIMRRAMNAITDTPYRLRNPGISSKDDETGFRAEARLYERAAKKQEKKGNAAEGTRRHAAWCRAKADEAAAKKHSKGENRR